MSIEVPVSQLRDEVARWGFAYVLSVGDDARTHVVALHPTVVETEHGPVLRFEAGGGRASRNVVANPDVTVVFPPGPHHDGMSLIIDGRATAVDGRIDMVPSRAVLHRRRADVIVSVDAVPLLGVDGRLWLCGLRDIAHRPDAVLSLTGATTVVCLNTREELERRAPDYADWLRTNQPGRALWFPIRNFSAESADATMPMLDMIAERLERGEGTIMHCAMGQGRAGTMAVCLLMRLGSTADDALRTVAAHRAFAGPGDGSQWALVEDVARMLDVRP